jgi:hypothetical protein
MFASGFPGSAYECCAGGGGGTVQVQVASSADDAEERASGRVGLASSDLELTEDKDQQTVGIRFTGVDIPSGSTITRAYVQFHSEDASSGASALTIAGELTGNAQAFQSVDGDISSRTRTGASVSWSPAAWSEDNNGAA